MYCLGTKKDAIDLIIDSLDGEYKDAYLIGRALDRLRTGAKLDVREGVIVTKKEKDLYGIEIN